MFRKDIYWEACTEEKRIHGDFKIYPWMIINTIIWNKGCRGDTSDTCIRLLQLGIEFKRAIYTWDIRNWQASICVTLESVWFDKRREVRKESETTQA